MPGTTADRSRLRTVGAELRALRVGAGLGTRELAQRAGMRTHARISLWENGRRLPREPDVIAVLDALDAAPDVRASILGMVREAHGPGRLTAGLPGVGDILTELIGYERDARRIVDWSALLMPGLLQTSEYARAIMAGEPHADARVTMRAGRREILTRRREPVVLHVLIDSEVLTRPVAPPEVMLDQLRHLEQMSAMPNVTIQIVSSTRPGWHPGLGGPFELIEFAKASPVVLLEHHRSSLFLWEPDDVQQFVDAAEEIRGVAMSSADSAEFIRFLINGQEKQ